jgi:hypothetical protein
MAGYYCEWGGFGVFVSAKSKNKARRRAAQAIWERIIYTTPALSEISVKEVHEAPQPRCWICCDRLEEQCKKNS